MQLQKLEGPKAQMHLPLSTSLEKHDLWLVQSMHLAGGEIAEVGANKRRQTSRGIFHHFPYTYVSLYRSSLSDRKSLQRIHQPVNYGIFQVKDVFTLV